MSEVSLIFTKLRDLVSEGKKFDHNVAGLRRLSEAGAGHNVPLSEKLPPFMVVEEVA